MKKTISINIKGINFMIEEDAYELLSAYLKRLEQHLQGQKGYNETLEDIELRIAELCQAYLSDKKQVIEIQDIERIIATLGQPEQFLDEEGENHSDAADQYASQERAKESTGRSLYRDVDQARIAGVCAGLANYFQMDIVIVRIIFLVFFFFGGFGFPLYIILWLVIPKATSSIDRLKMHGKAITVDAVQEEVEQAAKRMANSSRGFADRLRRDGTVGRRFSALGEIIRKVFGIGLILTGTGFLIVFLLFSLGHLPMAPIEGDDGLLSANQFMELVISDQNAVFWVWVTVTVAAFSGILFLISNGTYLLLRIRNKWTKLASVVLFVTGMVASAFGAYFGISAGKDWFSEAEIEREVARISTHELELKAMQNKPAKIGEFTSRESRGFGWMRLRNGKVYATGIDVTYRISHDSLYHVYQKFSAAGRQYEQALSRSQHIRHGVITEGNTVQLSTSYSFPAKDKLRDQEVEIIIEVPRGKWVRIDHRRISPEVTGPDFDAEQHGYLDEDGTYDHWDD